jgi:hypothetical protein
VFVKAGGERDPVTVVGYPRRQAKKLGIPVWRFTEPKAEAERGAD